MTGDAHAPAPPARSPGVRDTEHALSGRRIVVTRAEHQAGDLVQALRARGAEVVAVATIEIAPPKDLAAVDTALGTLASYDWLVFTSANGVRAFCERARSLGIQGGLAACRIACIGTATAHALEPFGLSASLIPDHFVGESFAIALRQALGAHRPRVLLARAEAARSVVPDGLRAAGCAVNEVAVYETRPAGGEHSAVLVAELSSGRVDAVTFTSPSTVNSTLALLGPSGSGLLRHTRIVTIGPVTTDALHQAGLNVSAEAAPHTASGLISALERLFSA